MKKKVLLGMSGGVDSSVAAMMLQNDGFEVIGITFLFSELDEQNTSAVSEAQQLAEKLGFQHIVADLRETFNDLIVRYFIDEYQKGNTPFPCARCNPEVKFKYLLQYASLYHCDFIATGHYAQVSLHNDRKYIVKGLDIEKDQSFFLWGLNGDVLDRMLLPLGGLLKKGSREYAMKLGFSKLSAKKDSLGVCFIEGNNYRHFLEEKGIKSKPGNFVNKNGEVLGRHSGIFNYTIGQRRGLGLEVNKPIFVSDINAAKNEIVLKEYDELYKNRITVSDIKFIDIQEINNNKVFSLKIRYRLQNTPCKIKFLTNNRAIVHLLEPVAMVANGQTAVFYDDDRVIGGGFIESSE